MVAVACWLALFAGLVFSFDVLVFRLGSWVLASACWLLTGFLSESMSGCLELKVNVPSVSGAGTQTIPSSEGRSPVTRPPPKTPTVSSISFSMSETIKLNAEIPRAGERALLAAEKTLPFLGQSAAITTLTARCSECPAAKCDGGNYASTPGAVVAARRC